MSALPVLSGRQLVKVLGRLGYAVDRQRGSHIILRHSEPPHRRLVGQDCQMGRFMMYSLSEKADIRQNLGMLGLRDLVKKRRSAGKRWKNCPTEQPWFDQPDALQRLARRRRVENFNDREFEALRHWLDFGYVVVRDVIPTEDIYGMLKDLDDVWRTDKPIRKLMIEELRLDPADTPGIRHAQLVTLDPAIKERLKRECSWRIHEFFLHSESTRRVYENAELIRLCSLILNRQVEPRYTINFAFGSNQRLHQDTAVFMVLPMNYLIGAWLACEDIDPDSGPLVYYPGSHKERLFSGFDNYPQTMLKTCNQTMMDDYYCYLDEIAQRYERKTFVPEKGEVFLWHGMMIHGGDPIKNSNLTRRSYVCHYIPPGLNKESEVVGPFNW